MPEIRSEERPSRVCAHEELLIPADFRISSVLTSAESAKIRVANRWLLETRGQGCRGEQVSLKGALESLVIKNCFIVRIVPLLSQGVRNCHQITEH